MGYLKSLMFCALSISFNLLSIDSFSQCDLKIRHEVKSNSQGSSLVNMKCLDGPKSAKIQLYDLNTGTVVNEVTKFIGNDFVKIFDNVKPSVYAFYVWIPGCKKPIVISEKGGVSIEN